MFKRHKTHNIAGNVGCYAHSKMVTLSTWNTFSPNQQETQQEWLAGVNVKLNANGHQTRKLVHFG